MNQYRTTMKYNGKVVAECTASATMTYEFQRAFWTTAAYAPSSSGDRLRGQFQSLGDLLGIEVGETCAWAVTRVDEDPGGTFVCTMERLEDIDA